MCLPCVQGDKEKFAGMPVSPLFDRGKPGVTKSQVGAVCVHVCECACVRDVCMCACVSDACVPPVRPEQARG